MEQSALSTTLRELRKNACYTQADVSRILNIQRQTYCNYENALRTPPIETLIALAELYHVSVDYLVRGTNNPSVMVVDIPHGSRMKKMLGEFTSLTDHAQKEVIEFIKFKKAYSK